MKIGIYVGSFNPVHLGHIDTANKLIENNYVDKVYIVPTLGYWNKHNLAPLKNRIEMLKLVSNNNIIIDDTNNKLEFTYQIMDKYHTLMPDDEIRLILFNKRLTSDGGNIEVVNESDTQIISNTVIINN